MLKLTLLGLKSTFCSTISDLDKNVTTENMNIDSEGCEISASFIKHFSSFYGLSTRSCEAAFEHKCLRLLNIKVLSLRSCNLRQIHYMSEYWLVKIWKQSRLPVKFMWAHINKTWMVYSYTICWCMLHHPADCSFPQSHKQYKYSCKLEKFKNWLFEMDTLNMMAATFLTWSW